MRKSFFRYAHVFLRIPDMSEVDTILFAAIYCYIDFQRYSQNGRNPTKRYAECVHDKLLWENTFGTRIGEKRYRHEQS